MDQKHFIARYEAILEGAKPFKAVEIPVKTQWDVDQYHKFIRLQQGETEKKEKIPPPAIEKVIEVQKNRAPFWFYLLHPKEASEIKVMVLTHIENRREAEAKLVHKFKLTHSRSCEIFSHFASPAQFGKRRWQEPVLLNGNTRGLKPLQKKPKNKKSPSVEVISDTNVGNVENPGISTIRLKSEIDSKTKPKVKKSDTSTQPGLKAVSVTKKINVAAALGGGLQQGQSIIITTDRERFYAGVKRILIIKLDFTDEQLLQILGKSARVKRVSSEHRTVTVELVVGNDKYEVVLPIDAVDLDLSS